MDLATVTDLQQLKALAYDQIALKEQSERNLAAINTRIGEVMQMAATDPAQLDPSLSPEAQPAGDVEPSAPAEQPTQPDTPNEQ